MIDLPCSMGKFVGKGAGVVVGVTGCGERHDMDLSGLGTMIEEFNISLNAQRRKILPHACLGGRSPFSILFPTKTPPLHLFKLSGCTPLFSSQRPHFQKKRNRGVLLASILKLLCLVANLGISSKYHLKNV